MRAIRQHDDFRRPRNLARDHLDLGRAAILVILALNQQYRAADVGEILLDIPAQEVGVQPDVVPAPERRNNVVVVTAQPLGEVGVLERRFRRGDAFHRDVFDEDVRRHCHHAANRTPAGARMNQRDRRAIAVADEDRCFDFELIENFGQHVERFAVHVVDLARLGEFVRLAVPVSRIHQRRTAGCGNDLGRETLPQCHRA